MKAEDIAIRALLTIRARSGKTQQEIADSMEVKLRTLQSYERKERRISDNRKAQYVTACGESWIEFLDEQVRVLNGCAEGLTT